MVYVFLSVAGNYGEWARPAVEHLIDLHVTQFDGTDGSGFGNKVTTV